MAVAFRPEEGKGSDLDGSGILSSPKNSFRFSVAISAVHLRWPSKYFTFTLSLASAAQSAGERGRSERGVWLMRCLKCATSI